MLETLNFIRNITSTERKAPKSESSSLSLKSTKPSIEKVNVSTTISNNVIRSLKKTASTQYIDDGLFVPSKQFLKKKVTKPHCAADEKSAQNEKKKLSGKLLEAAIQDITIYSEDECEKSGVEIVFASFLFKDKPICHERYPFNRKLFKFFIRSFADVTSFSIRIVSQDGSSASVPLCFPKHNVRNKKLDIYFSIINHSGQTHSGRIICTVSVISRGTTAQNELVNHFYPPNNDPNNPQRLISTVHWENLLDVEFKKTFLLENSALMFDVPPIHRHKVRETKMNLPNLFDIAVIEQNFSLMNSFFMKCCQYLRQSPEHQPSSVPEIAQSTKSKQVLTVTILRGIEVPVREESALVQPVVEVEWCNIVQSTSIADGPAPVWQQTINFKVSRLIKEQHVKLRLFDNHPIWGLQWLGEAFIPLECLDYCQEVERWIELSPLRSPSHLFGYTQASPGHSHTRLYVLVKMHQVRTVSSVDEESLEVLSKAIQKCITIPYKIEELEHPQEIAKLVTLLSPLPAHYGPLKPQLALNLSKVDCYGRAALLTALFYGLGIHSYVLLGASQISKLAAYCVTVNQNQSTYLWDPDTGDYYGLNDSRCSLVTVFRLIDPKTVWANSQKFAPPASLKFNPENNREWQPMSINSSINNSQPVQILHLKKGTTTAEQINNEAQQLERQLKDYLIRWREAIELLTTFNNHAEAILRTSFSENNESGLVFRIFDKKKLRQLYRIFYIHGFIINYRYTDLNELLTLLASTKSYMVTGSVEFALVCHIQTYVGKIRSVWLGLLTLKKRE